MKNYLNFSKKTIFTSFFVLFSFMFFGNVQAQNAKKETASITIVNNGKTGVRVSLIASKGGGSTFHTEPGKRSNTRHYVGESVKVTCNGKSKTFYVSKDSKQNEFVVNFD